MPPAQDGFQEEEALGKGYDARLMRRLLQYLRPYKWYVALAILILVVASFLQVVGPWLTLIALEAVVPNGSTSLWAELPTACVTPTTLPTSAAAGHSFAGVWAALGIGGLGWV